MSLLVANNLSKKYGSHRALDDVSFSMEKGQIVGLLGPNGAGKTTFVKSVLDLIPLSKGSITINGVDHKNKNSRVGIGYLPEKFQFYPYYKVKSAIELFAKLKGCSSSQTKEGLRLVIESFNIGDFINKKIGQLSKGQTQRLGLACALIGDPQLVILDEPFTGLDPIGMKELKGQIHSWKVSGKSILINSHLLGEVEKICDSFTLINKGKVISEGKIAQIPGGKSLEDHFYERVGGSES